MSSDRDIQTGYSRADYAQQRLNADAEKLFGLRDGVDVEGDPAQRHLLGDGLTKAKRRDEIYHDREQGVHFVCRCCC